MDQYGCSRIIVGIYAVEAQSVPEKRGRFQLRSVAFYDSERVTGYTETGGT